MATANVISRDDYKKTSSKEKNETVNIMTRNDYKGISPLTSPKQTAENEARTNYETATKAYNQVLDAKKQVLKSEINKMGVNAPKLQLKLSTNPTPSFVRNENGTTSIISPFQQNQQEIKTNQQKSKILSNNLKQNQEYQALTALEQPLNNQRLLAKYNYDVAKEDNHKINLFDKTIGVPLRATQDFLNIGSYTTDSRYIDENGNKMLLPQNYQIRQENVRNSYDDSLLGKAAKFGTDVGYNLTKIGLSSALNAITGIPAGSAMYFSDMGFDNFNQAKLDGYDDASAALFSVLGVTSEMLTEKFLGGFAKKLKLGKGESSLSTFYNGLLGKLLKNDKVRSVLSNAMSEGTEEFVQEFIENFNKNLVLKKENLVDATKNTFNKDVLKDALYSALVGMGSGGLMSLGNPVINTNNTGVLPALTKEGNINVDSYISDLQNALSNQRNQNRTDNINQTIDYLNLNKAMGNNEVAAQTMNNNIQALAPVLSQYSSVLNASNDNVLPSRNNQVVLPKASDNINTNENINQTETITDRLQYAPTSNEKVNNLYNTASQYFNNSEQTTNLMNTLSKVIKDKNYNIVFDNTNMNGINGKVETNAKGEVTITLNPDSPRAFEFVALHEITHAIETNSLKNMIMSYAKRNAEFNEALDSLKRTYGTNDVNSEVIADISGQLLGNQEFINNLSMEKPGLFKQLYNNIKAFYHKLRGWKSQDEFMEDLMNKWEYAYATQQNNLKNTSYSKQEIQGMDRTKLQVEDAVYRKFDETWSEYGFDIDDIEGVYLHGSRLRGTANENSDLDAVVFYFGNESEDYIFNTINDKNNQLVIDGVKVDINPVKIDSLSEMNDYISRSEKYDQEIINKNKVANNDDLGYNNTRSNLDLSTAQPGDLKNEFYDSLTPKQWRKYHNKMNKVMNSTYGNLNRTDVIDGKIVSTKITNHTEQVVNVLKLSKQYQNKINYIVEEANNYGYSGRELQNISEEMFGKENVLRYDNSSGKFIRISKLEQNSEGINANNRYNVGEGTKGKNIQDNSGELDNSSFSLDNLGNKLSKQQQNYFKNSKVRDDNGNLLQVYHGTSKDFTVFDKTKIGTNTYNDGLFGRGFYFTNQENLAEGYSKYHEGNPNVKKGYLNLENPFNWNSIKTEEQMQQFIKDNNIPEGVLNWNRYQQEIHTITDTAKEAEFTNALKEAGYDGVIYTYRQQDENHAPVKEIVAFESNQFKNANNTNPTTNEDIRYSKNATEWQSYLEENYKTKQELDNSSFPLEQRVSGDTLLDTQDLINEVKSVGAEVDNNGYVTLYHQTSNENAQNIRNTGKMKTAGEDYVYFSTSKDAQQSQGRGDVKLEFKIPAEKLELDDLFSDNADVKIKLNGKKTLDVSDYLVENNTQESNNGSFSLKENNNLRDRAKSELGTTNNLNEAGYLTTDGKYLDFSGKKDGAKGGQRQMDHRDVAEIYTDAEYSAAESKYPNMGSATAVLQDFIDKGNIRLNSTGIEIATAPTQEQYNALYDYLEHVQKDNGEVFIDLDTETKNRANLEYNDKTSISKMINDIKEHYQTDTTTKVTTTDNNGRTLSKAQQNYFKNSKVRDADGNLLVMYHGTPTGTTTEFRPGTYFTANKQYADRYQNASASSIKSADQKASINPTTYETYLNITNPFDISDPNVRDIYINEYIKGGYALGINPYLSESEYAKIDNIDWTEGENLQEFIEENHPEFDGIVLYEGGEGGYGQEVYDRGISYVVLSPNQVKNVNNSNPTTNDDIRYSKNNKTWQQYLEDNYISRGTRTFGKDIRQQETKNKGSDTYTVKQVLDSTPDTTVAKGNDVLRAEIRQDNNRLTKAETSELEALNAIKEFATDEETARLEYLENKRDGLIKYPELKQKVEFKDISKEYTRYKNNIGEFDPRLLNQAEDTVKGYRNTKTKDQWLDVAENIGLNFRGTGQELTNYAVQSWFEAHPNDKNSLNRQGKGYVKFSIDEWVNSVYKGAGVGEKIANRQTVETTNINENTNTEWMYERSKNTYFDSNRNDIYANDDSTISPNSRGNEMLRLMSENQKQNRAKQKNNIDTELKYTPAEISNMFQFVDKNNRVIALSDAVGERLATKTTLSPSEVGNLQNIIDSATNITENGNQLQITSDYNNNLYTITAEKVGNTYVIDDMVKGTKNSLGSVANIETTTNDEVESIDNRKSKIENGQTIGEVINKIREQATKPTNQRTEYEETVEKGTNLKESSFYKNATETSQFISEDNRVKLSEVGDLKYYEGITNEDSLNKASKRLKDYGTNEAIRWMQQDNKTSSATDVAEGWILLKNYQDAGDYDSMVAVAKKMRQMGTVAGQTIQAYNIMARLTPEGMVKYAQSELSEAFDIYSKNKSKAWLDKNASKFDLSAQEVGFIVDTMKQVEGMEDGRAKNVKLGEINKMLTDKLPAEKGSGIKAWMRISMLFNPKTQIRNIMGNAVITPVNMVGDFFAAAADKYIAQKTGVRTTGNADLKNYIKGFKKGVYESYDDFKRGINTRNIDANRFELGQAKSFNDNTKLGKALNRVDAMNSFLLDAGDRGFYEGAFTNSINNQLALNNTTKVTQDMIDIATSEALQRTWQDNNNYTKFVLTTRNMLNKANIKGYGLGDLLIPFAKTPANLTKAIVDYSPAGMVNAIIQAKNLKNNISTGTNTAIQQHQFVQILGKATAGTLLYVAAYGLAKAGIASGQSDDDKDTRDFIKNTLGISSYSIKIGDKSFTYDWAQPVAAPLSIMTNIVNSKNNKGQALLEAVTSSLDSAGSILLEQSFLKSINDVLTDNDGIVSGIENAMLDLPARGIPTFLKQIVDMTDGTQRQTFEYNQPIKTAINKIKAKIPGLSQTLQPSVDSLGREIQKYGGKNNIFNVFLNPANVNTSNISDAAREIYRVYKDVGDKTIMPRVAPYYINSKGQKTILNTEQRKNYQLVSGQIIESNINALLNNRNYIQMSNEEKSAVIKNIVDYSYNKAKNEVLGLPISGYNSLEKWLDKGGTVADYYANKEEANFSVDSPTKYSALQNMGVNYYDYKEYQEAVNEIKKRYSGTSNASIRKQKVFEYINGLRLSANQKVILFKMLGNYSIKNFSNQTYQYINSFNISAKEKQEIWNSLF